ncbi:MAG TPA: hypothetical protein VMP89_16550, partial [Solirubrobacteraceae bacterium]|nr:hypothetical protein [Solirubrobacteraceae bacterium]
MTPSAMTAAGRASARRATATRAPAGPAPAHRRQLRQRPAPAAPRRVSGPVVRRPRTAPAPRHGGTIGMRALAVVRSLPEHSLIDRLVRGRAWIPVLGVLLAGIVAMQVEVLKLGTDVGRWVQRSTTLQSQNESLQAGLASLNDDQRIERLAANMGMVMPAPATIAFVNAKPGADVGAALANIHSPDPTTFAGQLAAEVASAAAASPTPPASTSTASANSGTTTPTTSSTPAGSTAGSTPGTAAVGPPA